MQSNIKYGWYTVDLSIVVHRHKPTEKLKWNTNITCQFNEKRLAQPAKKTTISLLEYLPDYRAEHFIADVQILEFSAIDLRIVIQRSGY